MQHLTENIYIYDVIVAGSVYSLSFEVNSYYIRSEFVLHSKSPPRISPNQPKFAFRPIRSDSCSFGLRVTGVLVSFSPKSLYSKVALYQVVLKYRKRIFTALVCSSLRPIIFEVFFFINFFAFVH